MRGWPLGITIALVVVVAMNAVFIYLALSHAPQVEADYVDAPR